jgi:dihydroneopterin aldolase
MSKMARALADERPWTLVEEFAENLALRLFERFGPLAGVNILVKKFVLAGVGWSGVEISRSRGE